VKWDAEFNHRGTENTEKSTKKSFGDGDLVDGVFTFGVGNSAIAPDQISTVQTPPAGITAGWPLILMAVGLGVLLFVMIGVVLYARLVRGS